MALIHGHGGKFLLHGGKLETMTGDADTNRPAAGISTCYQQRDLAECKAERPRSPEFVHGHGGNFHLHNGHLQHICGDADANRPAAGKSTQELSEQN